MILNIIIMMIIKLSILFYTIRAIIVNPINESCIMQSQYSYQHIEQLNQTMIIFNLKPFSKSIIQIDLRHLSEIPIIKNSSQVCFELKAIIKKQTSSHIQKFTDLQTEINRYIFYIDQTAKLGIYFEIKQGYDAYKYLLFSSISMKVILENERVPSEASSFLFIISNLKNLNLPINRPNVQQYQGYYIDKIKTKYQSKLQKQTQSANSYWTTFNTIAIPFIPFISNCKDEINKLYLNQIMENQTDCTLIQTNSTISIKQFQFGSSPTADICNVKRQCVYDQIPGIGSQFPFWMNLPKDSVLFEITQNKIDFKSYQINSNIDSNQLVQCKINNSKGDNTTSQYPLNVKLTLQYYQIDQQIKKMISCSIDYSLYMESSNNFTYQFELQIKPLNHTYIMLAFGFQWYVYMIVFMIIGFISNIENLVLGMFHFCVSKKQKKQLRIKIYLRVIFQIFKGTLLALFLLVFALFAINLVMTGKVFDKKIYDSNLETNVPRVFWDYMNSHEINDFDSQIALQYRNGRTGYAFTITGACLIYLTSKFFIGCQKKQNQYNQYHVLGRQFKPRQWNQGRFIFGTYIYICIQFFFIYFAYSAVYSQNIWTFIVLMKVIQIVMQQITLSIYQNLLPCLPFKVITDITAYMNTLSADNLYDFLFSFLIDVAMTMIEKAYVSQLQNIFVQSIQKKVNQIHKFYIHLVDDTKGEAKQDDENKSQQIEQENQYVLLNGQIQEVNFFDNEEVEIHNDDCRIQLHQDRIKNLQKQINHSLLTYRRLQNKKYAEKNSNNNQNEEPANDKNQEQKIEQSSMIFEILLDNILLLFTFILQPFVVLVFWVNYQQSDVLSNYGISYNVVILYLLSALVIAFFTIMNMVLIFHLLQSYLGIDFEEKIVSLLGRFLDRKIFWKSNDEDINGQIKLICRGADHYCLSWQFFFILALYVGSMVIAMLGLSIIINANYNPLKDSVMLLVGLFWSLFVCFFWWGIPKLIFFFNIDNCKQFQDNGQNLNKIKDEDLAYQIYQQQQKQNKQVRINLGSEDSQNELLGIKLQDKTEDKVNPKMFSLKILMQLANAESYQSQINDSSLLELSSQSNLLTKVNTICKKLEPNFLNNRFSLQFFIKNKQFLKQNIDKILPLMHQLPDINQYKIPKNQIFSNDGPARKDTKTYDIFMEEVLNVWKYRCQSLQKTRVKNGKQKEQGLTECSFCFRPWGIYYGAPNICLQCSIQIQREKKNQ